MGKNIENGSSAEPTIDRTVALDVLNSPRNHAPRMGRTKIARWRTGVLVLVHVLIVVHVVQWLIAGTTVSPIEPSEAMETIEGGVINAGAIVFLAAIVATAFFGRFFCGWLCHMVAMQDLCAYIMNSMGIRPKPFRSRLLVFVPLLLGFYMFLWPTSKKLILAPLLKSLEIDWPAWLKPVHPIQRWENGVMVEDYWASFPDWYIAVPFLLISGFATVYFLGAKGLCTYACPYGGFFAPAERVSPVRVRVNDDCRQCGYCTSVCSSNVRVSEEVRDFGMVIDNGCMKTLDCISACPNDALSLGFGRPSLGAPARSPETAKAAKVKAMRRYDMTKREEVFAAIMFGWLFFATRGMLDQVPMLLAGGLAAVGTMMVMTTWWIVVRPNVRLYGFQLKSKGKVRRAGYVVGVLMAGFLLGSVWSGQANFARWRGDVLYAGVNVPAGLLMRPEYTLEPEQIADAEAAVRWYTRGDSFADGGYGWHLNPAHRLRLAYFLLMLDRNQEAAEMVRMVIDEGNPTDSLVYQVGELMEWAGATPEEIEAMMKGALAKHPQLHKIRGDLAMRAARAGGFAKGEEYWTQEDAPRDEPGYILEYMRYYGIGGKHDEMIGLYDSAMEAAREDHNAARWMIDIAALIGRFRFMDQMVATLDEAVALESVTPDILVSASELYFNGVQDRDRATELLDRALAMRGGDSFSTRGHAGGVFIQMGETERGRELLLGAVDDIDDPLGAVGMTVGLLRSGMAVNDMETVRAGIERIGEIVEENPDFVILRHDFASYLQATGDPVRGAEEMSKAAELEPGNVIFATRASEMWLRAGDDEKAAKWREEADRRSAAAQP